MEHSGFTAMEGLLCWCRPGFEPELAAELTARAAEAGQAGYARTERHSGVVLFLGEDGAALDRALPLSALIFARQKLRLLAEPFVFTRGNPGESVSAFITRRLGREVLDKAVEPFIAGTLAADPGLTCAASALPRRAASCARRNCTVSG